MSQAWGSAVMFWTTNKGFGDFGPASKYPTQNSFGGTYATINGNQECQPPTGPNSAGVNDPRVVRDGLWMASTALTDCTD